MKRLQEYIIEEYEINEGKLWDAIKKWFKDLFSDTDKKFNTFSNDFDDEANNDLKEYINANFKSSSVAIKPVDKSSLKKIVFRKNLTPNEEANKGFWRFKDEFKDNTETSTNNNIKYFAFVYDDDDVSDVIALLKCEVITNGPLTNYLNIKIEQVNKIYSNNFKMNDLFYKFKNDKIMVNYKGIFIYKQNNEQLYNKVLNDCGFKKEIYNSKNVAVLERSK